MLLPLSATYITDIQASLNGRFIVSANASPVHGRWLRNGHCQSLLYSAPFVRLALFLNQVCLALSCPRRLIHSGSFRLLPLLSVVGSTHHSASFDVNLNSWMMFSSLFAVVQSSEPRLPSMPCLGNSDFTILCPNSCCLLSCSRNPPVYPSSVVPGHSAPLWVVHLTHLHLLSGHELSTSLTYVCARHTFLFLRVILT